jgi:D-xylose transport system permease protein
MNGAVKESSRAYLRASVMIAVLGLIWLLFHFATSSDAAGPFAMTANLRSFVGGLAAAVANIGTYAISLITGGEPEYLASWVTNGIFLTPRNLSNLMTQMSVTGIVAVGMLMVIVAGHIDLSVGSVLGFLGGLAAVLVTDHGYGTREAVLIAILAGVVIGTFHGTLTAYLNIPAFIVTLGGLLAWRGAVKWLLGGNTILISNESFKVMGSGNLPAFGGWIFAAVVIALLAAFTIRETLSARAYSPEGGHAAGSVVKALVPTAAMVGFVLVMNSYQGVPVPVVILLGVAVLGAFLTTSTTFGRYLYAIGANAEAARLSGVAVRPNVVAVYGLLGGLAGLAGVVLAARVGSASPDAGTLKELDAIAACVIGGASLAGGRGTVLGACLGALIMASLDNGMSLLYVRDFMQDIIKGSILVAAVGLDMVGRK